MASSKAVAIETSAAAAPYEAPSLAAFVDPLPLRAPLSTTVQADADTGKIPWHKALMLIPHEFIRVEMLRVTRVIKFLTKDCALPPAKRWRVRRFHAYMAEWFRPMIIDHHETEEHICVPHVEALGEDLTKLESGRTDEGLVKDHEELMSMLKSFCDEHVAGLAAVSDLGPHRGHLPASGRHHPGLDRVKQRVARPLLCRGGDLGPGILAYRALRVLADA